MQEFLVHGAWCMLGQLLHFRFFFIITMQIFELRFFGAPRIILEGKGV